MKYTLLTLMLLMTGFCQAVIKPAEGLWSTTDDPAIGSGLMMTTQNGITLVSLFTYDDEGNNVWYIGSGTVDEVGLLEVELRQTTDGQHLTIADPQSSSFVEASSVLKLEFQGSQLASMQIGDSESKPISPLHFGYETMYDFPDLSGQWLVGNAETEESFIFDFNYLPFISPGVLPPVRQISLESSHPSTSRWGFGCVIWGLSDQENYCVITPDNSSSIPQLVVTQNNIGNQQFKLVEYFDEDESNQTFQAFRLNKDRRLLPNDGHWRPADDPDVGSGMVMRTQGDYTIALVYSYDAEGVPVWQIAAGQFDENGKMVAELNVPTGGTAIESESPVTANFSGDVQSLEIQLQGLELATFSIDGSTPKVIQNYNFGVELIGTEQVKVMDEPYLFPNQEGSWVLISDDLSIHDVVKFNFYSPNCCVSPRVPWYNGARGYDSYSGSESAGDVSIDFICTVSTSGFNGLFYLVPFCEGYFYLVEGSGFGDNAKLYFEDIGYKEFRYYIGDQGDNDFNNINRNSDYIKFYRLDNID